MGLIWLLSHQRRNESKVHVVSDTFSNPQQGISQTRRECTDFLCFWRQYFSTANMQMMPWVTRQYHADILQQCLKWKGYFGAVWHICTRRSAWFLYLQIQLIFWKQWLSGVRSPLVTGSIARRGCKSWKLRIKLANMCQWSASKFRKFNINFQCTKYNFYIFFRSILSVCAAR